MWELANSLAPSSDLAAIDVPLQSKAHSNYTQGMMDLGATLCTRSKPACHLCPLASHCEAFAQNRQHELPHKKPKKTIPTKRTTMLIAFFKGCELLHQRPASGIWGGLWGFVECKDMEQGIDELSRKLQVNEFELQMLEAFRHTFSHFHLEISPVVLHLRNQPAMGVQEQASMWYPILEAKGPINDDAANKVGLAAPTVKILNAMRGDL